MRKILFNRESACIQPLRTLIEQQKHRTLAMWALESSAPVEALLLSRYPLERRPSDALTAGRAWMRGEIKMPVAKQAILAAHAAATELESDPVACAAARALAHAAATVHVETHALGLVFYGLTAFVFDGDPGQTEQIVSERCDWFYDRLLDWQSQIDQIKSPWASFLIRDDVPNKEWLLRQKTQERTRGVQAQSKGKRDRTDGII